MFCRLLGLSWDNQWAWVMWEGGISIFLQCLQGCKCWIIRIICFSVFLSSARDIKIFLARTVDHITEHSKMVMTTMGEWELLDITSHHHSLDNPDYIDELAFHVRCLNCLWNRTNCRWNCLPDYECVFVLYNHFTYFSVQNVWVNICNILTLQLLGCHSKELWELKYFTAWGMRKERIWGKLHPQNLQRFQEIQVEVVRD